MLTGLSSTRTSPRPFQEVALGEVVPRNAGERGKNTLKTRMQSGRCHTTLPSNTNTVDLRSAAYGGLRHQREKLYELLNLMNPKYAEPVANELDANGVEGCSDFTMEVLKTVIYHVEEGRPLAFPDAVAEAYLQGKKVPGRALCIDCRYWLPNGYFTICPVCNGRVGF